LDTVQGWHPTIREVSHNTWVAYRPLAALGAVLLAVVLHLLQGELQPRWQ